MIFYRLVSMLVIFQLLVSCGQGNSSNKKKNSSKNAPLSIQGKFEYVTSQVINLILPSAYAEFEEPPMELSKELAVMRGRTDGLEARIAELESRHPVIAPITDKAKTKCNSLENSVSFHACPKGEYCAFIREVEDYRNKAEFSCGVILNEDKSFNFQFSVSAKEAFAQNAKLEVVMVNGDYGFDHDMFNQAKEEYTEIRSRLNSHETAMSTCEAPCSSWEEIGGLLAVTKGMIDGNEAKVGDLEARNLNVILGLIVDKENHDEKLFVDEKANLAYWSFNRFEKYTEYHQDPWMNELKKLMTYENILVIGQWALNHEFFGVEDPENPDWNYTQLTEFFNNDNETTVENFDPGRNWAYLALERFSPNGFVFGYDKELHEYDEDIVYRKYYLEFVFSQIIFEKATNASAPIISVDKMIAGLNSLDSSIDHELLLKYFRAELYLLHALDMEFDMAKLQGIVTIRDAVKDDAIAIITSVQNWEYLPDVSCDWVDTQACVENFKKDLVINIASSYFSSYFGNLSDPYLYAPEAIRNLYIIPEP